MVADPTVSCSYELTTDAAHTRLPTAITLLSTGLVTQTVCDRLVPVCKVSNLVHVITRLIDCINLTSLITPPMQVTIHTISCFHASRCYKVRSQVIQAGSRLQIKQRSQQGQLGFEDTTSVATAQLATVLSPAFRSCYADSGWKT